MKTIKENNRLIAEFMGYETYEHTNSTAIRLMEDNEFNSIDIGHIHTKFHTSWDWLMPVVKEIKLSGFVYGDRGYEAIDRLDNSIMDINIDEVHKICVDIIEWYNNHQAIEDEIAYDMDRD